MNRLYFLQSESILYNRKLFLKMILKHIRLDLLCGKHAQKWHWKNSTTTLCFYFHGAVFIILYILYDYKQLYKNSILQAKVLKDMYLAIYIYINITVYTVHTHISYIIYHSQNAEYTQLLHCNFILDRFFIFLFMAFDHLPVNWKSLYLLRLWVHRAPSELGKRELSVLSCSKFFKHWLTFLPLWWAFVMMGV